MRPSRSILAVLSLAVLAACETPTETPTVDAPQASVVASDLSVLAGGAGPEAVMDAVNAALADQGVSMAVSHAEWIDGTGDTDAAKIVFANNRTLRLGTRWVPGDPRRGATSNDLTQGSFFAFQVADGVSTEPIVDASFATWNGLRCSNLTVNKVGFAPGNFPSAILGLGGFYSDPLAADISNIGWLPGFIFDLVLGPGASGSVLGVTFTFIWLDSPGGPPSDIDGDGRNDTALKEVWYNDDFTWSDTGGGIDVETVALHENGHALELGHFGKLTAHFNKKGIRIQASPRAVMNATYIGPYRSPAGTDNAAMCGNFASWPD